MCFKFKYESFGLFTDSQKIFGSTLHVCIRHQVDNFHNLERDTVGTEMDIQMSMDSMKFFGV